MRRGGESVKKRGRPKKEETATVSVRVPVAMVDALYTAALRRKKSLCKMLMPCLLRILAREGLAISS